MPPPCYDVDQMKEIAPILMLGVVVCTLLCAGCISTAPPEGSEGIPDIPVQYVQVGDIEIAYKSIGSGDPLVMIIGYSATMDMWSPEVLRELSSHYRVVIFDNRGLGYSTASDQEFTIPLFVDDTAGLMDALGIGKAHVLGWSMGSYIAQELALKYPEKVDRLVLYASDAGGSEFVSTPENREADAILANTSGTEAERGMRYLSVLFPKQWLDEHPDPSTYFPIPTEWSLPENIQRQYQAMLAWNGTYDRLPQVTQDTLLITGTEDVIPPPVNSFVMGGQIPGAWVVQIRGAGHGLMYQYPERFAEIVLFFLGN